MHFRLLVRMFSLAQDNQKITLAPKFELPKESPRQGFLPHEIFQKLFDATPAGLQPLLLLLYHTGVRVEAEKVEWSAVNLDQAQITLRVGGSQELGTAYPADPGAPREDAFGSGKTAKAGSSLRSAPCSKRFRKRARRLALKV